MDFSDMHTQDGDALNSYGDIATHEDCSDNYIGGCSGHMLHWENPHTGNTRLLCEAHADKAESRQAVVQSRYLNDTIHDEDY